MNIITSSYFLNLCFCHSTVDNKYPHLKVPQEGFQKLYICVENDHFSLFVCGQKWKSKKNDVLMQNIMLYYMLIMGWSLVILLFTSHSLKFTQNNIYW